MSDKINLAELREVIDHDPFPEQQNLKMAAVEVLALIDAVDAARLAAYPAPFGENEHDQRRMRDLRVALARFDFGPLR